LVVGLRNVGMPSIAERWALSVKMASQQPIWAEQHIISPTLELGIMENEKITYTSGDALYEKAVQAPIPTGAMVRGVLLFVVKRIQRDTVARPEQS
jgi:hypothetical protein